MKENGGKRDADRLRREALAFLSSDRLRYIDMIEVIERGSAEVLDACKGGVLLHERASGAFMMTAVSGPTALEFFRRLEACEESALFLVHEGWYLPELERRFLAEVDMVCRQAAWLENRQMECTDIPFAIRALGRTISCRSSGTIRTRSATAIFSGESGRRRCSGRSTAAGWRDLSACTRRGPWVCWRFGRHTGERALRPP